MTTLINIPIPPLFMATYKSLVVSQFNSNRSITFQGCNYVDPKYFQKDPFSNYFEYTTGAQYCMKHVELHMLKWTLTPGDQFSKLPPFKKLSQYQLDPNWLARPQVL